MAGVDGAFVVAGGLTSDWGTLDTVFSESAQTGGWGELPSLQTKRCCAGGAVDKRGSLWVVGGGADMYRNSQCSSSVEQLDAPYNTHRWRYAPSLGLARCALGVACDLIRDRLFACGGYGGGDLYHDTAEWLDLSALHSNANSGSQNPVGWAPLPRMSAKRAGPNAAMAPDGRLFVLGGGPDGILCHRSMEALDIRMSAWDTALAQCQHGRHYNAAAFGPDGLLYVAGAFRHDGQLDVVERYDPRADRWESLPNMARPITFSTGTFLF